MKKSLLAKIKCAIRKWMSAKVIPYIVLNGSIFLFYRLCGWSNSGWCTLQNYREIGNHRSEVIAA